MKNQQKNEMRIKEKKEKKSIKVESKNSEELGYR